MTIVKSALPYTVGKLLKFLALLGKRKTKICVVPISACRHYAGFRYGTNSLNPYENYIDGLHQGVPRDVLKRQFEDFLVHYRPENFGEVFGINLTKKIPLWVFPWDTKNNYNPQNGWLEDLDKVPDIITHFCEQGIKRSRIEEEYFWLERAYSTISNDGYQPDKYSYIRVCALEKNKKSVYIVTDGNHRLGALSALGNQLVEVRIHREVNCDAYSKFARVRNGTYSHEDAFALIKAYFEGVDNFDRAGYPAKILEI